MAEATSTEMLTLCRNLRALPKPEQDHIVALGGWIKARNYADNVVRNIAYAGKLQTFADGIDWRAGSHHAVMLGAAELASMFPVRARASDNMFVTHVNSLLILWVNSRINSSSSGKDDLVIAPLGGTNGVHAA